MWVVEQLSDLQPLSDQVLKLWLKCTQETVSLFAFGQAVLANEVLRDGPELEMEFAQFCSVMDTKSHVLANEHV